MATPDVYVQGEHPPFDHPKGDAKSRGFALEKKIEYLESLNDKVSNRRARRWINDRILLELVPRLTGDEIRGLFAPPPWGDEAQPSAFSMTNVVEWDKFRNIDMDKEAVAVEALKGSSSKKKSRGDADKIAALTAWHRVDCRTREAFRRSFLPELVNGYEENIRAFVSEAAGEEVLVLYVQDPFHRLLLHGVCEVDAFSDTAFKGNSAAVCWLGDIKKDDKWLQSVASEFNIAITCYLSPIVDDSHGNSDHPPRFHLRWFTPTVEVKLCGHGTLAVTHFLFESGLVNSTTIEYSTHSGSVTVKKVSAGNVDYSSNGVAQDSFYIELEFPAEPLYDLDDHEVLAISDLLNGVSVVELKKTSNDIFLVLPSAKEVVEFKPQFSKIKEAPGRAIIITALAPDGSEFDFYSRVFDPKIGVNEDPVTGTAHCALASYWHDKLGKCDFLAYQASPRSGTLHVHLDKKNQRVLLRGKATTVMEGSLLV
uniref:uncharacterized isomerase BH0283 isoform X2 n=1 Tax=Erigeron canadensis TaxID=72917 RepID=UPI001CB9705E|nr:uncharacterized isomerase BH0283 isoform X2 [Erigeron canadensis]